MASLIAAPLKYIGVELSDKWPIVGVAFLMMLFAFGFPTFALPFVYAGAVEEFGWTREQAVLLASFKFYTAAVASLVVGRLLDTVGPKYIVTCCAVLGGLGMLAFVVSDTLTLYYAVGVILGLNAGGMAVCTNVLICRVFEKSMGTALGLALAGTSTAGIIVPLVIAPLMEAIGWRAAMGVMSLCIWLLALPVWFLLFAALPATAAQLRTNAYSAAKMGMWAHFKGLSATRNFWFIVIGIFLVSAVDQGLMQNQVLFLKNETGLELGMVAWGAAMLAAIGIVSKIAFGWVYDRLSIPGIALCYVLLAVSAGLSFAVAGIASMLIFVTTRGIAHGGLIVDGPVLASHYYGPDHLGLNIGIFTLCTSIGFGFGPPLLARIADESGSYLGGFALAAAVSLLAAALLYPIKPRFWVRGQ